MNFIPYLLVMGIVNKNKAKKMVFKGVVLLFWVLWILTPTFTEAKISAKDWLNYIVEIAWAYMDQYFSMVHFNVAWNDFWWGILWLPVEQISGDVVEISIPKSVDETTGAPIYDTRYCSSKVRGFYWNSQRWDNRLWPLDDKTHQWLKDVHTDEEKYAWLTITWWWYTTCSEDRETVELNAFLESNWISVTLSDIANIITELSNYTEDERESHIDEIIATKHINNIAVENRIKNAILSWVSFEIDPYGIYWKITHDYKWEHIDLIAWAHYDIEQNRISTWDLTCSLQRLSNNYPFWYLYDDYGHIWIVWARIDSKYIQWTESDRSIVTSFHTWLQALLDSWVCMNEIFWFDWKNMTLIANDDQRTWWYQIPWRSNSDAWTSIWRLLSNFLTAWNGTARTTIFSLWIKGIVWLSDEVRDNQKEYFENNQLQSTLMLRTETSISNVINVASRNAERLCRGKWKEYENWVTSWEHAPNIVCLSWFSSTSNVPTPKQISWKTIIVRNADFTINMNNDYQSDSDSIDLFIDKGNLLLDTSSVDINNLKSFDDYWYLSPSGGEIRAMFLKGNFIINGLLLGGSEWTGTIENRLYMHGKLISYNTITVPTTIRKATIASIIGRGWTEANVPEQASLTKLFWWWCNPVTWEGSDGTSCKWSSAVGKESQLVDKAFWLIDMDLPSEIIKN